MIAMALPLMLAALGQVGGEPALAKYRELPPDARAVVERRIGCNHWSGEDAYDAARARQIRAAVRRLHCGRLERDEARLRRRYRSSPKVLKALADSRDEVW